MKVRKAILYTLFLVALLLPILQMHIHFFDEPTLGGTFVPHEKPALTAKDWFNGSFQPAYEQYINDTLGFHPNMVRCRNAFLFKVFRQTSAQNVVIGQNDYLYEQGYIDAHYGTDYIGVDSILRQVQKIRALQDSLAARDKILVVFLAPSKADFYPEYIPRWQQKAETDSTNHQQYRKMLKQHGVNVIDYNTYYQSQKAISSYPLYPKYGIHWSDYGIIHAMDSLVNYIRQKSDLQLPRLVIERNVIDSHPRFSDFDLGTLLNLPDNYLPNYPLCYPDWHWTTDTAFPKPTLISIADSYYWGMFNKNLQQSCFQGSFWYYNSTVYPESYSQDTHTRDLDLGKEIEKADVILIMSTTPGLSNFSWGAVDSLLKVFTSEAISRR
ncbi:MAG: hypothetical protein IKU03_04625 [Bacteroidales bacterium]|nr:hypothetical protein [Bacteroidales bacterium]